MDKMSAFADELADAAVSAAIRFIEIADKYGMERNEVAKKACMTLLEMAFSVDYSKWTEGEKTDATIELHDQG